MFSFVVTAVFWFIDTCVVLACMCVQCIIVVLLDKVIIAIITIICAVLVTV